MEQEKKKNGGKLFIGLLIGLIIGIGSCYTYFYFNPAKINSEKSDTNNAEKKGSSKEACTKNYDTTESIAYDNLEKYMVGVGCDVIGTYFTDHKVVASDISNLMAYNAATIKYNDDQSTLTAEQVEGYIKALFGKDYNYQPSEEIQQYKNCNGHYYDPTSNNYPYQSRECGWTCGPSLPVYNITKATEEEGVLTLDVRVAFRDIENDLVYYSNSAKTQLIPNVSNQLDAVKNGGKYRFTLKEEDGNYIFVSSEPIS